jgi:hypothetical protein
MSETAAASWVSRDFEGHRIDLSAAIAKDIRVTNFWRCFGE